MARDYEVGYGRPPVETQFKKGQSGNPAGRKKGSKNLATMVHAALSEKVAVNINGKRRMVSKLEAAFIQQSNRAAGGDAKAVKLMLDIMVGAEGREAGREAVGEINPEARRRTDAQILEALRTRLQGGGGDDGDSD